MDQSVSFVTVATVDLNAAWTFYVEGLGWEPAMNVPGEVIFFQVGPGVMLGFFDAAMFVEDMNAPEGSTAVPAGFTLAHNVQTEAEVDEILAAAAAAGAVILKPAQHAVLRRLPRPLPGPERGGVGGRPQPRLAGGRGRDRPPQLNKSHPVHRVAFV